MPLVKATVHRTVTQSAEIEVEVPDDVLARDEDERNRDMVDDEYPGSVALFIVNSDAAMNADFAGTEKSADYETWEWDLVSDLTP